MPDLDNDNPTPDFDALIEQARQLREEGRDDEAIAKYEEAMKIDRASLELCELMELYIKRGKPSHAVNCAILISSSVWSTDKPDAGDIYKKIFDVLNTIPDGEIVDSPGMAYEMLAMCTGDLGETDPYHLSQNSRARAIAYGWTAFHTKCHQLHLSASEENHEETLATLREWTQEDPAAWFYVGRLEQERGHDDEAKEAYGQVPENDPNYARSMFEAGDCWELDGVLYEAEDYYQKALDVAPRSQEVRLEYLFNRIRILLEEAAENGFDKGRVERASEFAVKLYGALGGSLPEAEKEGEVAKIEGRDLPLPHPEMYERYMSELAQLIAQLIMNHNEQKSQEILTEIRAGRQDFQSLQEQVETHINASAEATHKYIVERLQAYQEQIADCERRLNEDHSEFWEQLTPESRRYLATGDYIREKSPAGMECSGEAIEYAKTLETELRQHLVEPFVSFAERQGNPNIFGREHDRVTLGAIFHKLEPLGLRTEFANSLGEKGRFLRDDFHALKKIKKLRDAAAHGGDIGRQQATKLRDLVLKILPKIVALRSR